MFSWVKAHIGVYGNEMADNEAKEAARSTSTRYEYTRIPKLPILRSSRSQTKMANRMDNKLQGGCNKIFSIRSGQTRDKTLTTKLEAVLMGDGKTRAYLYRLKLRDDAKCICGQNDQTLDHLLFHCEKPNTKRP